MKDIIQLVGNWLIHAAPYALAIMLGMVLKGCV